jgi:hypothetical protein
VSATLRSTAIDGVVTERKVHLEAKVMHPMAPFCEEFQNSRGLNLDAVMCGEAVELWQDVRIWVDAASVQRAGLLQLLAFRNANADDIMLRAW